MILSVKNYLSQMTQAMRWTKKIASVVAVTYKEKVQLLILVQKGNKRLLNK